MSVASRGIGCLVSVLFFCVAASAGPAITKDDLVKMAKAGLDDALVLEAVAGADGVPALTVDDLVSLKNWGVSQRVLRAVMVRRNELDRRAQPPPSPPTQEPSRTPEPIPPSGIAVGAPPPPPAPPAPPTDAQAPPAQPEATLTAVLPERDTPLAPVLDPDTRIREFDSAIGSQTLGKALATLLGKQAEVGYEGVVKATEPEKAILDKVFLFWGRAEEFTYGESSPRLTNIEAVDWAAPCPAMVFIQRDGAVHVLSSVPVIKLADNADPCRLNPTDNLIQNRSKTRVEFYISVTKHHTFMKKDTKYMARIKCESKDLGALLAKAGWKRAR